MKTLYISDLDGTLLTKDEKLSSYTADTLNHLINSGMIFSYATARSLTTAKSVTSCLNVEIPVIVYNGAFIVNPVTKEIIRANFFTSVEAAYTRYLLSAHGIHPIVYSYINGVEKFSFYKGHVNYSKQLFLESRKGDPRRLEVNDPDAVFSGDIFYYTCIDPEEKLTPVYDALSGDDRFYCVYQRDIYLGELILEILPAKATKANAIMQLKDILRCDKVISFGDALNDVPMFKISDECYAVANASAELKALATDIIESNANDGVAKWLACNVTKKH